MVFEYMYAMSNYPPLSSIYTQKTGTQTNPKGWPSFLPDFSVFCDEVTASSVLLRKYIYLQLLPVSSDTWPGVSKVMAALSANLLPILRRLSQMRSGCLCVL